MQTKWIFGTPSSLEKLTLFNFWGQTNAQSNPQGWRKWSKWKGGRLFEGYNINMQIISK